MPTDTTLEALDPIPAKFDPEKRYEVRLKGPISYAGMMWSPMHANTFPGEVAEQYRDMIDTAREV